MSECLPYREVGRRNRETRAAAGVPLGTKPSLKSQHAGWLNSGPRQRWCSVDTDSARKYDYVWVKCWLRPHNLLLMIITITGLGPRLTKLFRMGSNTNAAICQQLNEPMAAFWYTRLHPFRTVRMSHTIISPLTLLDLTTGMYAWV